MDPHLVAEMQAAARRAIALVCIGLPHLSGLAHSVRIGADDRVGTAGIFESGRLLINPSWFLEFTDAECAFVIAHELLHLALHTHARATSADPQKFNIAHDLIINDMLEVELGMPPPGGGIRREGARHLSAEALMLEPSLPSGLVSDTQFGAVLRKALGGDLGSAQELGESPNDVLDTALEIEWFPDETPQQRHAATQKTRRLATKALSLQRVQHAARKFAQGATSRHARGGSWAYDGGRSAYVDALTITYCPPWQLALHRWLDTVMAPQRTYARASRRAGDRTDIALPGRIRDSQTLSIVLDTSGSMAGTIAHALGSIMAFGRGANIDSVRIVQCDTAVTSDEVVAIDDLATNLVVGYGGSDMTPAMMHLADDPDTTAAVVITDGAIDYPGQPMPYHTLWVVYGGSYFDPPYGQVIHTLPEPQAPAGYVRITPLQRDA
jgi:predicted metal-dependent peptidase